MSQFSEMMGSFVRTGNYPLEANYVFESLKDLQEFYLDPINNTTLHPGLLRVVQNSTAANQELWWAATATDSELQSPVNISINWKSQVEGMGQPPVYHYGQDMLFKIGDWAPSAEDYNIGSWEPSSYYIKFSGDETQESNLGSQSLRAKSCVRYCEIAHYAVFSGNLPTDQTKCFKIIRKDGDTIYHLIPEGASDGDIIYINRYEGDTNGLTLKYKEVAEGSEDFKDVWYGYSPIVFKKLATFNSLDQLNKVISDLVVTNNNLNSEITTRFEEDEKLAYRIFLEEEARKKTDENVSNNLGRIKAIVGTDNDDISAYLQTLPYKSLTEVTDVLNKFINTIDNLDEKINTLPELEKFLEGYNDTDKLVDVLKNLYNSIVGTPNKLKTLESLESALLTLTQITENRANNLQTEIDQTQVGVGLSGDGAYNPDKETYYLQDATSVMNALKTLDRMLHKQLHVDFNDTDTIDLEVEEIEEHPSRIVTANVKIAPDSDIIVKDGSGLYHKVDITFVNGLVTLLVNGEERTSFNLGIDPLLEEGYYDKTQEKIVLIFKLHSGEVQRVEIPASDLILEWSSQNTSSISLQKTRVVDGTDVLTATLNISEEPDNGAEIKDDGVFVSKNSKDLIYKDKSVEKVIETILDELDWYFEE